MRRLTLSIAVLQLLLVGLAWGQTPQPLTEQDRKGLADSLQTLEKTLDAQTYNVKFADAAIFAKGLAWGLKYDMEFSAADVALLKKAVSRGTERAKAIAEKKSPWLARRGKVALGYKSRVDDSVQPYGLIVPKNYDPEKPIRLDVVLHGSTRPVGMSELRFMARFDEGDGENATPPDAPYIELHPLGRVENCYRWAGETDVFEAIADVCHRYNIDKDRIVLRGMSMGASGSWHLGLKHPDFFVALGPYCGYVDTHKFSETPLPNFVKVGPLPEHQELGLHMLDSVDYAANAGVVPAIACMGEKDVFFQAHVIMGEAMKKEGLTMVNLISPGTGHVIDPVTHAEQMKRIKEFADKGLNHQPSEIRFVTWTLKYSGCHWLEVLRLEKHYARAEISARLKDEIVEIDEPKNITKFAILTGSLPRIPKVIRVGDTKLNVPTSITEKATGIMLGRKDQAWEFLGEYRRSSLSGKRPGLTGPIDVAFMEPFLCVRGTGKPWNKAADDYAKASLKRFAEEWHHYFRGELPVKNDTAVTEEDLTHKNLILFGDPGSNSWIAKALPKLPLKWTSEKLTLAEQEYSATDHIPALIAPNPLRYPRYIVLNSGHTFREAELNKLNYLLFPRWGDWAVLQIDPKRDAAAPAEEKVLRAGYFDENFR
ncbi:MAG: prolyl oligopeptidase family serine peptidase [Pirellulaceae bacterium]